MATDSIQQIHPPPVVQPVPNGINTEVNGNINNNGNQNNNRMPEINVNEQNIDNNMQADNANGVPAIAAIISNIDNNDDGDAVMDNNQHPPHQQSDQNQVDNTEDVNMFENDQGASLIGDEQLIDGNNNNNNADQEMEDREAEEAKHPEEKAGEPLPTPPPSSPPQEQKAPENELQDHMTNCQICYCPYDESVPRLKKVVCPMCANYYVHHRCWYRAINGIQNNAGVWKTPCCRTILPDRQEYDDYRDVPPQGYDIDEFRISDIVSVMNVEDRVPLSPMTDEEQELEDGEIREDNNNGNNHNRNRRHSSPRRNNHHNQNQNRQPTSPRSRRHRHITHQRRRRWNTTMSAVYHRLLTLAYFRIIDADTDHLLVCYLGHQGIGNNPRFRCPREILEAEDIAAATNIIIKYNEALGSQFPEANRYIVTQFNRNTAYDYIGKLKVQREVNGAVSWYIHRSPSPQQQRQLFDHFNNNLELLTAQQQDQVNAELRMLKNLRCLARFPRNREWNDQIDQVPHRLVNWPAFGDRIPVDPADDGVYEWKGTGNGYDIKNCLNMIYDIHGRWIGRESDIRLSWSGLRLLQCRDRANGQLYITSWFGVPYPSQWSRYKRDFDMTVAYWVACEIEAEVEDVFGESPRLFRHARSLEAYKEAMRIKEKYLRKYQEDGSRIGHNHRESIQSHLSTSSPNR